MIFEPFLSRSRKRLLRRRSRSPIWLQHAERLEPRALLAANLAPINVVPSAQTVTIDQPFAFTSYRGNQISISDPDAGSAVVEVTLSVNSGTLDLINKNPGNRLTYTVGDGVADSTLTVRGTIADLNTALSWINYQPKPTDYFQWAAAKGGNDHWYQVVSTTTTWAQAKADAELRGGYLATATSAGEQNFVNSLFSVSTTPWLGGFQNTSSLSYSEPGAAWEWVTGEAWSYTAWTSGQPDNSGGAENFLTANASGSMRWNDAAGTLTLPYLVEYNTDPRPAATTSVTLTLTTNDLGNTGTGGALSDTDTVPITLTAVPSFTASPSFATYPAVLDTSLNSTGKQVLSTTTGLDYIHDMRVLPSGKILAVGAADDRFGIYRFNADLTLDTTFGTPGSGGGTRTDFGAGVHARSFAIDSSGRIIVVGGNRIARYTSSGVLDTTFGTGGSVQDDYVSSAYAVAIQPDGKILSVGRDNYYLRATRLSANGIVEANWEYTSFYNGYGRGVTVKDDGDILLFGSRANNYFNLIRIDSNGAQEQWFQYDFGTNEFIDSALALPDGKFLMIGRADDDLAVSRYLSSGQLDTTFGTSGIIKVPVLSSTDEGYRATLAADGKILITGFANNGVDQDIVVVRMSYDGVLDTSFNGTGKVSVGLGSNDYGYAVTTTADGKIVVAGRSNNDIALVRLLGDSNQSTLPANQAPVNSVPGAQTTQIDTPLAFTAYRGNGISIADPDNGGNQVQVTLSVNAGTITLIAPDPNGGLTYSSGDGTEDASMTFTGTVADINAALSWISYRPAGETTFQWATSAGGNGHWYRYFSSSLTWAQAKTAAEAAGGYLATVTSAGENTFVNSLFGSGVSPWIGGYQDTSSFFYSEPGDAWKWVTGEAWSYTNWNTNQPDNSGGSENFLQANTSASGKWNDAAGSSVLGYVVEFDSDPRPPASNVATLTVTTNDGGALGSGGPKTDIDTIAISTAAPPIFSASPTYTTLPATLDTSFNSTGKRVLSVTSGVDYIHDMKVLPSAKILAVGAVNDRFGIMRFNADLSLDATFGGGGGTQTDFGAGVHARSFTIDSSGRIIVVGGNRIARYTSSGVLDTTFGTSGSVQDDYVSSTYAVAIQPDGKILSFGRDGYYFRITRLSTNGVVEANWQYNPVGTTSLYGRSVVVKDDGDILLFGSRTSSGSFFNLIRIDSNGVQEQSFQYDFGANEFIDSALALPDGKFLMVGRADNDLAVSRHLSSGQLDTTFGSSGIIKVPVLSSTDEGYRATLAADGKILITGFASNGVDQDIVVVRMSYDGVLDTSFGTGGTTSVSLGSNDYGYAVATTADGKIVIAGRSNNDTALVRLLGDFNLNSAPEDITLSPSSITENSAADTLVGTFTTTDPNAGDTFTYTLASGTGSTDNTSFTIVGNELRTAASFNFEVKTSYSIRVRSTDQGGLWAEKVFLINVTDVNETPTDISLSSGTILENQPAGTTVGILSTSDPDAVNTFVYSLVSGTGSTDNASFVIEGGALKALVSFDFELKASYVVRVRATDQGGLWIEKAFTVSVGDMPNALAQAHVVSGLSSVMFAGVPMRTYSSSEPGLPNELVGQLNTPGTIPQGIDVGGLTALTFSAAGQWNNNAGADFGPGGRSPTISTSQTYEYFDIAGLDNAPVGLLVGVFTDNTASDARGTPPTRINAAVGVIESPALNQTFPIGASSGRIRVPVGATRLYFGLHDAYIWSDNWGSVTVTVTNAPLDPTHISLSVADVMENQPVGTVVGAFATTDPNVGDSHTYALVSGTGSTDNDSFRIQGGQLRTAASFDFETKSAYAIRVRSTDQGGLFTEQVFAISVTNVNDPPTLSGATSPALASVAAAVATPTNGSTAGSTLVSTLVDNGGPLSNFTDPDGNLPGIAITGMNLQGGRLWFSVNSGNSWQEITQASTSSAALLYADSATRLFFSPASGFQGTLSNVITFRAWDRTGGFANGATGVNTQPLLGPAGGTLSTGSWADVVAVSPDGRYAFTVDHSSGLVIADISNPFTPIKVGTYKETGQPRGVAISASGRYAFYATGYTGLQIIDVSIPSNPIKVGGFNTTGFASFVSLSPDGKYAYVADGNAGLRILDVTNPSSPRNVGGIGVNDWARGVAISADGNYAFVSDWTAGLKIVDVRNPVAPAIVASFATAGYVDGVAASPDNRHVLVAVHSAGLQIINVTNPSAPAAVGRCDTVYAARRVAVSKDGMYAFVADGLGGLTLVDIRTPSSPQSLYQLETGGSTESAAVSSDGSTILVANGSAGLRVVGLSNAITPFSRGSDVASVRVNLINATPTDLALPIRTITENAPTGASISAFSTTDPDYGDTFTYTLVSGTGSTDNASFSISGNSLRTAASFDFEAKSSYSIRVRSTDQGGLFTEKTFMISVTNVNDAPSLSPSASPTLASVAAAVVTPTNGSTVGSTPVSALVDNGGPLGNFIDPDGNSPGIAITGLNLQGGRLWFSVNGGTSWQEITQASTSSATLLHADNATRLFFSPANGFQGTLSNVMTFRAWDRTGGHANGATGVNTQPLLGPAGGALSTGSWADVVAVSPDGRYAFTVAFGGGLNITDISNPLLPVEVGSFAGLGSFRGVTISSSGRYAFVATAETGVQILDISDPTKPIKVATANTPGYAGHVTLSPDEKYAFIADGYAGLQIIDVTAITAPRVVGGAPVSDFARTVVISPDGYYAYVADWTAGLKIFDVRNPAIPTLVASFTTANYVDGLAISKDGRYLFAAVVSSGLQVIDVGNPAKPVSIGTTTTFNAARRVVLSTDGNYAFVADEFAGLTMVAIGTPSLPTRLGSFDNSSSTDITSGVATTPNGRYVVIADGAGGLRTLAISAEAVSFSSLTDVAAIVVTPLNAAPTNIGLSASMIAENQPSATPVGTFSTTDQDSDNTFNYTLVSGTGSTDNALFTISGNTLQSAMSFDFEAKGSYSIRVRTTDQGGLFTEKTFTISVTNVNEAPNDVSLSNSSITEKRPVGTTVGTLSTSDPDTGNTFTYTFVSGAGSADNASFTISGNVLRAAASFNYDTRSSYSIRVRSTDQNGLSTDKVFEITVISLTTDRSISVAAGVVAVDNDVHSGFTRLVKRGPGSLVLALANSHSSGTVVEEGELIVRFVGSLGTGTVVVKPGAKLSLDFGPQSIALAGLQIHPGGLIDVGMGRFVLSAGTFNLGAIRDQIRAGRAEATWAGTGGITSVTAARTNGRAIGHSLDSSGSLIVGFAGNSDLNLDGVVDFDDVVALVSAGCFDTGRPATWDTGDVNYDDVVDFDDIVEIVSAGLFDQGSYLFGQTQAITLQSFQAEAPVGFDPINAAFASLVTDQQTTSTMLVKKKSMAWIL